ncbi:peptide deformylase [Candidatus Campbellbacteria bacterium]|nr:MAG: peptide deformylase [Candidatus Campbellbacteria bacterium]
MSKLKIYQKENPEENKVLRSISEEIPQNEITSSENQKLIDDMTYFLEVQPDGAALAAPQVGVNKRLFIVSPHIFSAVGRKIESADDLVFINPEIIKTSKKSKQMDEGCFSVRYWYGDVKRSTNITISAFNKKGVKKTWGAGGILAQVFQHEIDHLDGILFCDKAKNLEKMSQAKIDQLTKERKQMEKERNAEKKVSKK